LRPYALPLSFPTFRFLCGSWWTCWTTAARQHTWRLCSDGVLATEEPLSVILPSIRDPLDLVWTPELHWSGPVPDWRGLPCRIGRVEMWLPIAATAVLRPFSLLALLPERDPPEWLPYVLLGVQFLQEYRAVVSLDCSQVPAAGSRSIP
jgi:hypothetical protein